MEPLYSIRNLLCSYNHNKVVLCVRQLEIPIGKIVFFVGPSGVGKSTILETLGLMNNTILAADSFLYKGQDFREAKKWSDSRLSAIRNDEFSFVFQQNNLMPNFSAYENMLTSVLFQKEPVNRAYNRMMQVLDMLELPREDRPINKFSGGQQQRIAFARAILPKFSVLFGDEPTGNLDMKSARSLMNLLVDAVRQNQSNAIIVSHDFALAVDFADIIVQIRKENDEHGTFGVIDTSSVFFREGKDVWKNGEVKYSKNELKTIIVSNL